MRQVSNFSSRLKEYIKYNSGITYENLSKLTGENPQTLNRYALGQRIPKIDSAVNIALKLGVSPMWLQGFDEPMYLETKDSPASSQAGVEKLEPDERDLLADYRLLNTEGKRAARIAVHGFTDAQDYKKSAESKFLEENA